MADKGYCSKNVKNIVKQHGYIPIIAFNKRNTKDKNKIIKFNKFENVKYKKRIIVENYYGPQIILIMGVAHYRYKYEYMNEVGWLKIYPKMMHVFEKTINSFENLVYFISSIILFNRFL